MNAEHLAAQVLHAAQAQLLVSEAQVQAAHSAHQAAVARGQTSNLLVHLSDQLDPGARASVRKIYHQAVRSTSDVGGLTRCDVAPETTARVDPNMTYMEPAITRADPGNRQTAAVDPDATLQTPPLGIDSTRGSQLDSHEAQTVLQPTGAEKTVTTPVHGAKSAPLTSIPGYSVVRELGRGGMGVVYQATAASDGTSVAVKVLLAGEGASPTDLSRFRTEAETAARLDHPHIVPLLEHGETGGNPFMVLEFIEGEDLDSRIEREGNLDPEDAVEIAIGVADALAYAHELGVLHRDMKPQNVLLDAEGAPLLTDFGLAKLKGEAAPTVSLTQSGMMLGTPAYMSPEQANAERHNIDERTDVYGLGATLFHMLTGQRPFAGPTLASLVMKILNQPPPKPRSMVPDLDPDLETIVLKCLEKEREDRYASASQLLRDLTRWQKNLAIVAAPPSIATRAQRVARKNPVASAAGIVACLVVVIGVGFVWNSMRENAALQARLEAMEQGDGTQLASNAATEPASDGTDPSPGSTPVPPVTDPALSLTVPADTTPASPVTATTEAPSGEQPTDEQPTDEQPADEPPTDEQPADEPPTDEQPADEPPTDEQPADGPPTDEQPTDEPPTDEPPAPTERPEALPPLPPASPHELRLMKGMARLDAFKSAPAYLPTWNQASEEARQLNVPIVIVVFGPKAWRLSASYLRVLDERAVTLIAGGPHPPAKGERRPRPPRPGAPRPGGGLRPGEGPTQPLNMDPQQPCPELDQLRCGNHLVLAQKVHQRDGVPHSDDALRLVIYTPDGQKRLVGAKRGADFKLSTTKLREALEQVQTELGEPSVPFADLKELAPRFYALEKRQDPEQTGRSFVAFVDTPGLLGGWARFRAREAFRGALKRAHAKGNLSSVLPKLRKDFGAEAGCARMLDEVEQRLNAR